MAALTLPARVLRGIGTAGWLLVRAGRGAGQDAIDRDGFAQRRLAEAFATYLWRPLPVLAALAVLVGIVAGTATARLLALYHAEVLIEPPLVRGLFREVVPLLVGIFASGRVSVELAARLAGTAFAREIDALEALGHDPVRHLLSPALVAVVMAVPVHMGVAALLAWSGAGLAIDLARQTDWTSFLYLTAGEATARALAIGTLKTLLFSLIAIGVGSAIGSAGSRGAAEIGERATSAFTIGLLAIVAAAAVLTLLE